MATTLAGRRLGINPFDQPNVEAAKVLARQMVAAYQKDGVLPTLTPTLQADGITVYADVQAATLKGIVNAFLAEARPGASPITPRNIWTCAPALSLRTNS